MSKQSSKLNSIKELFEDVEKVDKIEELEIDANFISSIEENALFITEKRNLSNILHSVESVLLTVIFAFIGNANTFEEIELFMFSHVEWLEKHIHFDNGIPSISTIRRVIAFINPDEIETICAKAISKFIKVSDPIYKDQDIEIDDIKVMDGKTANSSDRKTSKEGEVAKTNAMSLLSVKNDYCEATEFISDKTNEIPTGPELLKKVNIKNCLITFDALSTQTNTIKYIVNKKGYYVAPVKGNQKTLEENLIDYFNDAELYEKAKKDNCYITKEKAHGTLETREYVFTNDIEWLTNREEWPGLKSIGIAKRTYEKDGKEVIDIRYYISNIDASKIRLLSDSIRGEWSIENKLHYYLDMVFLEDDNTAFVKNTQKNLNLIRKLALLILKNYRNKNAIKKSINSIRYTMGIRFEEDIIKCIGNLYSKEKK